MDYAIVKTGGKQYRVSKGDLIDVEKLSAEPGAEIELLEILALSKDGEIAYGAPLVSGAKVVALVQDQARDKKVVVFKYKRKTRYRRKRGHRQPYTRLSVLEIVRDEDNN